MNYKVPPNFHQGSPKHRFSLGLEGKKPLIVFGVNPSTADLISSDRTINRVIDCAKRFNYDGWIMMNIYAQRSTNPKDLDQEMSKNLHDLNMKEISDVFQKYPSNVVCAAWGMSIHKRKYLLLCLEEIHTAVGGQWKRFGKPTKNGHPKHPARLPKNVILEDFDILNYLQSQK